jgi:hypothetical protein
MSSFCRTALKSPSLADKVLSFANRERSSAGKDSSAASVARHLVHFAALPELYNFWLFFSNRLMSNPTHRSEAVRDMEANLVPGPLPGHLAGLAETYSPHPFIVLPFANPYIPWPPYFDYLSHFVSVR